MGSTNLLRDLRKLAVDQCVVRVPVHQREDASYSGVLYRDPVPFEPSDELLRSKYPSLDEAMFRSMRSTLGRRVRERHWVSAGQLVLISGGPLSSAHPCRFELDDREYPSVDVFYAGLKARQVGSAPVPRGSAKAKFEYEGEVIAVNSAQHEGLIARALAAKVEQNPTVGLALDNTGDALIRLKRPPTAYANALGRTAAFALMFQRWQRKHDVRYRAR